MRTLALALFAALAVIGCLGPRTDGPLASSDHVLVQIPAGTHNESTTWGMPITTRSGPITLRGVELLEVSGVEVLGIKACEGSPWNGASYLNCAPTGDSWPPPGVVVRDVVGTTIGAGPTESGGLLVGVRLAAGQGSGTIKGVRIEYSFGGTDFEVTEPWDLELTWPGAPAAVPAAPAAAPSATPVAAPSATPVAGSTVEVGDWIATCSDVAERECKGVAELFINNLAWSGSQVRNESGGRLTVTPRPQCPHMADYNDDSFCWQAKAIVTDGEVCMVVAHHLESVPGKLRYGQVGGDDMTGRAIPIPDYPPCV